MLSQNSMALRIWLCMKKCVVHYCVCRYLNIVLCYSFSERIKLLKLSEQFLHIFVD